MARVVLEFVAIVRAALWIIQDREPKLFTSAGVAGGAEANDTTWLWRGRSRRDEVAETIIGPLVDSPAFGGMFFPFRGIGKLSRDLSHRPGISVDKRGSPCY